MHALYNLKEMLCKELEEFGERGDLTAGSLATVDTLAHALKNLDKVIMAKEDEMGQSSRGGSYYDGESYRNSMRSYRGSYDGEGDSYARGYSSKRDSMGRYSRDGSYRGGYSRASEKDEFVRQLQELVDTAPDDSTRQHVERLIRQMDQS